MTDYIFQNLSKHLMSKPVINATRIPTFYPSSASCVDEVDRKTIYGACLRQQWYRCMGYEESNPSGLYSQYIFAAGLMWESFLVNKFKEMGIWLGNNIKFAIPDKYISGELDILVKDKDGGTAIVESKTYSSVNYLAKKEICGSRDSDPTPKLGNLIQAFIYQYNFKDEVNCTYLTYLDRACGGPDNNKEFKITVEPINGRHYPRIETTGYNGERINYVERKISIEGVFARFESLMKHLQEDKLPAPDFRHAFLEHEIEAQFASGDVPKTKYELYKKNPTKYPIGNWECSYCGYSDTCKARKKLDGHH